MSMDYTDLADTAAELIADFGAPASLERIAPIVYDPTAPVATVGGPKRYACNGVDIGTERAYFAKSLILEGDSQLLVTPPEVEPMVGDNVLWGSKRWRVVGAKPIAPGGTAVAWILQVRA